MAEVKTDEELVEDIKKWWKENGRAIIVGITLGLAVIFGWRSWQNYQETQAYQASDQYSALMSALKKENNAQAKLLLTAIQKEYPNSPYSAFSSMAVAKSDLLNNDLNAAKTNLTWALEHAQLDETQEMIQLRLARLLISENKLDEANTMLNDINDFVGMALELKGDIALIKGDTATARAKYMSAKDKGVANSQVLQMKIDDLTPES